MSALEIETWPQVVTTERLTLRPMEPADREAIIDLVTNGEAYRHLGGCATCEQAEASVQPPYGEEPGAFVIVDSAAGQVMGIFQLDRHDPSRPGHVGDPDRPGQGELEVGYTLHADHWGNGYGTEAVTAGLAWVTGQVTDRYVIAVTQTANTRSVAMLHRLGFVERERFMEFGDEQTLMTRKIGERLGAGSGGGLNERDGHLLLPSGGAPLTDDDVRRIRLADQR